MIRGQHDALEPCWCKSRGKLGWYTGVGVLWCMSTSVANSYDLGSRPVVPVLLAKLLLLLLFFSRQ